MPLPWSMNLWAHGVSLLNGGFIHTSPFHGWASPSSAIVNRDRAGIHGTPSGGDATSMSNVSPRVSNIHLGVYQSSFVNSVWGVWNSVCWSFIVGLLFCDATARSRELPPKAEGRRFGWSRLSCEGWVVCVPHYLAMSRSGSLSSFVRWTTIRNVRLNADRSLCVSVYPRYRVFPQ